VIFIKQQGAAVSREHIAMPPASYETLPKDEDLESYESEDEDQDESVAHRLVPFLVESRDGFAVAQKAALQVACWTTLYSAIAMFFHRQSLSEMGFSISSILCNMLFIVGSDLGSTLSGMFYGIIGSFWALLVNWIFLGFFPGGYTGENTSVYYIGLAVIFIYTFLFIALKVPETMRFWALISFTGGYAMNLVNPADNSENLSSAWHMNEKGYAENAFILYILGGALALLVFAIPYLTSLKQSQTRVVRVAKDMADLIQETVKYYSRSKKTLKIYDIKEDFQNLGRRLKEADSLGSNSWYESCGKSTRRAMTLKLFNLQKSLMEYGEPLLEVVIDEDFKSSHTMMMSKMKAPMLKVVDSTMSIVSKLIAATEDGVIDDRERQDLQDEMGDMPRLVEALQQQVEQASKMVGRDGHKAIQDETLGEHYVSLTICRMAQLVLDEAEKFLHPEGDLEDDWSESLKSSFTNLVNYDRGDIKWAARSSICLLVNFLIGVYGWCDAEAIEAWEKDKLSSQEPVCVISKYTSGLASINVVLMSRYSAGTIKAALDRVAAVVFASVVGTLGFTALGWCSDGYRIATIIAVFFVTWGFMYLKYDGSGDTAGIAQRLAAITVASLMADCSNDASTATTFSGKFHELSDIIIGVLVMNIFDMMFGEEPAAGQAITLLTKTVTDFQEVFKAYIDGQVQHDELKKKMGAIESQLSEVVSLCATASMEPRFWRMSFNSTLMTNVTDTYKILCNQLLKTSRVLDDDKKMLLDNLPCFNSLRNDIVFPCLDSTTDMVLATILRDQRKIPDLVVVPVKSDGELTVMLVNDLNNLGNVKTQDREGEMHLNPVSRCCAMTTMMQSMVNAMRTLQKDCVSQKLMTG